MAWAEHAGGARLVVTPCCRWRRLVLRGRSFPAFVAYLCFNRGVELLGAARAGQYSHLMPAFGIVLAVLFLGERLHVYHLAGMALIGAGLVLADRSARGRLGMQAKRV